MLKKLRAITFSKSDLAIIVVSLLALLFLLSYFNIKLISKVKNHSKEKEYISSAIMENNDRKLSITELGSEGVTFPPIVICDNDSLLDFSKSSFSTPKIVFRITKENCLVCVDSILANIFKLNKKLKSSDFIIIGSFLTLHEQNVFKRNLSIKNMAFRILQGTLNELYIERSEIPYLFVLKPDMTMTNIYIPDKYYPEGTESYIKLMVYKFFKD